MKKRLLAIALCGLMLTILSACSADTASSSEKNQTSTVTSEESSEMSHLEESIHVPESSIPQTDSSSQAMDEEKQEKIQLPRLILRRQQQISRRRKLKIRIQNQHRNRRPPLILSPFPSLLRNRHRNLPRILSRLNRLPPHSMWKAMSRWQNPMGSP